MFGQRRSTPRTVGKVLSLKQKVRFGTCYNQSLKFCGVLSSRAKQNQKLAEIDIYTLLVLYVWINWSILWNNLFDYNFELAQLCIIIIFKSSLINLFIPGKHVYIYIYVCVIELYHILKRKSVQFVTCF